MSLSPAFLDDVRSRTSLSALVGKSVKLVKAGREYKAPCPFHGEKTPSFYVNDEKGFYHCFGCSAHGDAIRWLVEQAGLPFIDAVGQLAAAAGLDMPARDTSPAAVAKADQSTRLLAILEQAARWYSAQLESAGAAREYLAARGIDDALVTRFGLGWAPGGVVSVRQGRPPSDIGDLIAAGLVNPDPPHRDFFWERIMIPVRDARGRVTGFAARALGEQLPKYLNSRDGPVFDKGRLLYNLDRAGPAARQHRRLLIVEGQLDCIALSGAGIDEAVAPMGTALTEAQMMRAWRVANVPVLLFDGDSAGRAAAVRACERAMTSKLDGGAIGPGRSLAIALCPDGEDPDSLVRSGADNPASAASGGGRAAIEAVIAGAVPLSAFLFDAIVGAALVAASPVNRTAVRA